MSWLLEKVRLPNDMQVTSSVLLTGETHARTHLALTGICAALVS